MYADTPHGFNVDRSNRLSVARWSDRLFEWLSDSGFLDHRSKHRP
jgi:hypothetical protein